MNRRFVRLIVSALAAAGIAGGGALLGALAGGTTEPSSVQLWGAGLTATVQFFKDIQSSLSEPPTQVAKE